MHNRYNRVNNFRKKTLIKAIFIELAEDDEQFSFKIVFHGNNNRSYILGAESQEAMEQWMKALACASYDYIKLMVTELQRQLDDIEGTKQNLRMKQMQVKLIR